jgi:hypothetical protein
MQKFKNYKAENINVILKVVIFILKKCTLMVILKELMVVLKEWLYLY